MADAASLIAEHKQIENHLKAQDKIYAEYKKPYQERQEAIKADLLNMLNELNAGKPEGKRASLSTDAGTAYLSTIITPRIKEGTKEDYLDWVLADWDQRGSMLQIGAPQKDAIQEYMDNNDGRLPPFVETTSFTRVNIRSS